jgi:hypothetical protein
MNLHMTRTIELLAICAAVAFVGAIVVGGS